MMYICHYTRVSFLGYGLDMTIFTKSGDKKKSKTVNIISCQWDFCLLVCYLLAGVRNADGWDEISNDAITLGACFHVFSIFTDCLLKRLQRIQFAAASFVFGRYVNNIDSILKLGWLPMKERREWHVLKAAHKAIYSDDWPRNLPLEQVRHARNLRSSSTITLVIPYASDTFQYSAAALFNSLPSSVKCCYNFKSFSKRTLCILRERCRNRAE